MLRRIVRRATRFAYLGGVNVPLLSDLVELVFASVDHSYPELEQRSSSVARVIRSEEESFLSLLPVGTQYLERQLARLAPGAVLDGAFVFELNDCFGFPVDLTAQICGERGVQIDLDGVRAAQERHRVVSKVKVMQCCFCIFFFFFFLS